VLRDALEGARYAMGAPGVGLVLLLLAATCFTGRPVVELLPGWAGEIFAGTASDLAALTSAIGIGAVIGGLWLAGRPSTRGLVKAFLACCFGLVASVTAFALASSTIVALPLMVVAGFFLVSSAICAQTMVQLNVADEMRGRVLSLYAIILRGGPAVGALLMGFVAESVGLRAPQIIGMLLLFLATLAMLSRRREMEAALEGGES
jgi:predicted MFS family arabinose efflux permease